jgi:ATP-dependent Clp protease ATP-binding subunit ClpA
MTSNVGARELAQARVGFGERGVAGDDDRAYKNTFSPEFRNRLDARIFFKPLSPDVMGHIVEKFVRELGDMLADRHATIVIDEAAREYLGKKGYDPQNGARPLGRVIEDEIKRPLGDEVLFGALEHGGTVHVGLTTKDGAEQLSFRFEPRVEDESVEAGGEDAVKAEGGDGGAAGEGSA